LSEGARPRTIRLPGEGSFLVDAAVDAELLVAWIAAHRATADTERILKRNLGTFVTRVRVPDRAAASDLPREVVVKEVPVRPGSRWRFFLGAPPRLAREFAVHRRLRAAGFRSPRPLAASLRLRGATEMIVSEFLDGFTPLHTLLWLAPPERRRSVEPARILGLAGDWLRRLHEAGTWQRDMKPSNLLTRDGEFCLVDVAAIRFLRAPLDHERRVRNLTQLLDLSADLDGPPRAAMLRAYLGSEEGLDAWLREVGEAIERRRTRRERRCGHRHVDEEHRASSESRGEP